MAIDFEKGETLSPHEISNATQNLNLTYRAPEGLQTGSNLNDGLSSVDLRTDTNISVADLSGRSLRGSNLNNVELLYANIFKTDFSGASIQGMKVDLRKFLATYHSAGSELKGVIPCTYWKGKWDELPNVRFYTTKTGCVLAYGTNELSNFIVSEAVRKAKAANQFPEDHPYAQAEDYRLVNARLIPQAIAAKQILKIHSGYDLRSKKGEEKINLSMQDWSESPEAVSVDLRDMLEMTTLPEGMDLKKLRVYFDGKLVHSFKLQFDEEAGHLAIKKSKQIPYQYDLLTETRPYLKDKFSDATIDLKTQAISGAQVMEILAKELELEIADIQTKQTPDRIVLKHDR